ncbi:MAG: hypothetical protein M1838_005127 [Thelocarpon superellum]|nr:MAG: hypothetical protein M1838_005127 [Thelocarpon superellum]
MGKKRKLSGPVVKGSGPREYNARDSKLGPITTYEDVADSEDEFLINRDKILLDEGPAEKRRRQWREEEEALEPSDVEVLGRSDESSDDEGEAEDDLPPVKAASLDRSHRRESSEAPEAEDGEEVYGGWGSSRKDYYDADPIETEADALAEEAEARRLQQKRLQAMSEADFTFDEDAWRDNGADKLDEGVDSSDDAAVVTEVLPELEIEESMGVQERLNILKRRYPEFEYLATEFMDLQALQPDLSHFAKRSQKETDPASGYTYSAATLKYQALTAYLGALTMYFSLLTSPAQTSQGTAVAMSASELREHSVMDSLVRCRGLWQKTKELRVDDPVELITIHDSTRPPQAVKAEHDTRLTSNGRGHGETQSLTPSLKKAKTSKKQRAVEAAQAEAEARRTQRIRETEQELLGLSNLADQSKALSTRRTTAKAHSLNNNLSEFGEETALKPHDLAEKARKKKTLRFYTSQIAQKSNRRDQAGKDAGGDADLPYRERLQDRQARLNAEAEKRGQKGRHADASANGDRTRDLDDADSDDNDRQTALALRAGVDADSDLEYYDLVARGTQRRKAAAAAERSANAATTTLVAPRATEEETTEGGKRAIGYQIAKNKGLAPKRKKEVRNPRVKKRLKFEEKKKKLGSVRQLYRGGEGRGGYGGEATGIKTGLVKSVRL